MDSATSRGITKRLADLEFSSKRKRTHDEIFFEKTEAVLALDECIVHYFRNEKGRLPIELEIMSSYLERCIGFSCSSCAAITAK